MIVPVSHAALIALGSVGCDAHSHSCTYWPIHSQGMGVYGHNLIPACAPSCTVTNSTQWLSSCLKLCISCTFSNLHVASNSYFIIISYWPCSQLRMLSSFLSSHIFFILHLQIRDFRRGLYIIFIIFQFANFGPSVLLSSDDHLTNVSSILLLGV